MRDLIDNIDRLIEPDGRYKPSVRLAWACILLVLAFLFSAVMFLLVNRAEAHDAVPTAAKPQGWAYPFSCCSGFDCREVPFTSVREGGGGYVVPSGEVVAYSDKRIKDSPDGEYHWCSVQGKNDGKTICLFVPPRSY